jgi:HEAT repeat protein
MSSIAPPIPRLSFAETIMRHWWSAALVAAFVVSSFARGAAAAPETEDLGPKVKAWIGQLEDKDRRIRYQAIAGLAKAGPKAAEAIPALEKMKQDPDSYNQSLAAYALAYIRPDTTSKSTPQELLAMIKDKEKPAATRSVAAGHLAKHGAAAAAIAYDDLVGTLKNDNDAYTRALAAYALPYLKPKSPTSAPALAEALRDKNKNVARTAASSLAEVLGKDASTAAPTVILVLAEEKDAYHRALAAYVLGSISPDKTTASAALVKATKDENAMVQEAAKAALKKVDPDTAKKQGIQ